MVEESVNLPFLPSFLPETLFFKAAARKYKLVIIKLWKSWYVGLFCQVLFGP